MNQHIQLIINYITYIFIVFLLTKDICNLLAYLVVQQAHGFCVRRGDVQTWSIELLMNVRNKLKL